MRCEGWEGGDGGEGEGTHTRQTERVPKFERHKVIVSLNTIESSFLFIRFILLLKCQDGFRPTTLPPTCPLATPPRALPGRSGNGATTGAASGGGCEAAGTLVLLRKS